MQITVNDIDRSLEVKGQCFGNPSSIYGMQLQLEEALWHNQSAILDMSEFQFFVPKNSFVECIKSLNEFLEKNTHLSRVRWPDAAECQELLKNHDELSNAISAKISRNESLALVQNGTKEAKDKCMGWQDSNHEDLYWDNIYVGLKQLARVLCRLSDKTSKNEVHFSTIRDFKHKIKGIYQACLFLVLAAIRSLSGQYSGINSEFSVIPASSFNSVSLISKLVKYSVADSQEGIENSQPKGHNGWIDRLKGIAVFWRRSSQIPLSFTVAFVLENEMFWSKDDLSLQD